MKTDLFLVQSQRAKTVRVRVTERPRVRPTLRPSIRLLDAANKLNKYLALYCEKKTTINIGETNVTNITAAVKTCFQMCFWHLSKTNGHRALNASEDTRSQT